MLFLQGFEERDEEQQLNSHFNLRLIPFHSLGGNSYRAPTLKNLTDMICTALLRNCGKGRTIRFHFTGLQYRLIGTRSY
jgi:hypothetical protein